MTTCQFCGLDTLDTFAIYDLEVCFDCTDLAELAYEGEGDYLENMAFDIAGDR